MDTPFPPTEPYKNASTEPSTDGPDNRGIVVDSGEAVDNADAARNKRNKKIGLKVGAVIAGVGTLAGGIAIVSNIMRGPSQGGPNPVDTPTSEGTPSPEATNTEETFDATKFDIPATATDQEIGQGYTALIGVELSGNISAEDLQTEYENRPDFGQTIPQFAREKAEKIIDQIFKEQYVDGWENVPNLQDRYTYYVTQHALRIQAYILTADNPANMVFSEKFVLEGTPVVNPGTSADQKIATIITTETNNAAVSGLRQEDKSFESINGTTNTSTITYVVVGGKLRILDEVVTTK